MCLFQMLAGVGDPVGEDGGEAGGFEAGGRELVEGMPFEADPVLCGREGLVRGDAIDGEFEN